MESSEQLREVVAALKHDLGKYVAWRSANLEDSVWEGEVTDEWVDALRADLLTTRTTRDGAEETAWDVWVRLAGELERPLEAELASVEQAVTALRESLAPLRAGDRKALAAMRGTIREAQGTIRAELRALQRRLAASEA